MGLGIIIWILGITETLIYYYFVSSLTDQEFETHRFYFLVCGIFIGSLVAYNRISYHVLVSWPVILLQVILEWLTIIVKNRKYTLQKLSLFLFINSGYALTQILVMYGLMIVFPGIQINNIYYYSYLSISICLIPAISIFFISGIIEKVQVNSRIEHHNYQALFFVMGGFSFFLIINCQIQINYIGRDGSLINFIFLIFWLVFCITIIFFFIRASENAAERVALELSNEFLKEKYDEISNVYYDYATVAHDMKNHLIILEDYCQNGKTNEALEYIRKIKKPVTRIKQYLFTGDEVLNIILNYKLAAAEQEGITVEIEAEPVDDLSIENNDLCAILANLIDNAINACCEMEDSKDRWINIKIKRQGYVMIISISNSCCASIKKNDKEKDPLHGYGKKSVMQKVKKYKGEYTFKKKIDSYEAVVTFDNLSN